MPALPVTILSCVSPLALTPDLSRTRPIGRKLKGLLVTIPVKRKESEHPKGSSRI